MPGSTSTATAAVAVWLHFAACAALIGFGGFQLTRHAEVISGRTGLSGSWIGLALVATVTSLPELATGITSAAIMGWNRSFVGSLFMAVVTTLPELAVTVSALRLGAVDLAIGNLLGSNLFNVTIIAVDDLFYRRGALLADASLVHAVTAASAIVMTGLAMVGLFFRPRSRVLRAVGWVSLGLFATYLLNTYVLYLHGD